MIGTYAVVPLELRHYSDLSRHIKEPQNGIYCLNFLKKVTILKLRLCFIPKVSYYVLSVGTFVSELCSVM